MSNKQPFQKFIQQKETGAKKKERIRQEKKKVRRETNEYFEQKKRERFQGQDTRQKGQESGYKAEGGSKKYEPRSKKYEARSAKPEAGGRSARTPSEKYEPRSKKYDVRSTKPEARSTKPVTQNPKPTFTKGPAGKSDTRNPKPAPAGKPDTRNTKPDTQNAKPESRNLMPLNKFIAHAGICSRRDAVDIVKSGRVIVNQQVVKEPGFKVTDKDEIKVNGKRISARKILVYILLNKPKDFITTTEDPEGRKTVMDIVRNATPERVYPIGRLDRNTTGVLLLTNDGELSQKLSHPSYEVKKIYEVKLDKPLAKKDFETISNGVTLEDGVIAPDVLAYADPKDKSVIGIEIHSGRNRIVRRIFEAMGYDVRNLDRVMYANLTKKNVERGKWRFLTEKEVRLLKFLNASYTRK